MKDRVSNGVVPESGISPLEMSRGRREGPARTRENGLGEWGIASGIGSGSAVHVPFADPNRHAVRRAAGEYSRRSNVRKK